MNGSLCECGVFYVVICFLQCPTGRPGHLMSSLQLYRTLANIGVACHSFSREPTVKTNDRLLSSVAQLQLESFVHGTQDFGPLNSASGALFGELSS